MSEPIEIKPLPPLIYAVVRDSPAWEAIVRMCTRPGGPKPGEFFQVSQEEFDSLQTDMLVIEVRKPDPTTGKEP